MVVAYNIVVVMVFLCTVDAYKCRFGCEKKLVLFWVSLMIGIVMLIIELLFITTILGV
jgi:hypothetical protein